MAKRKSTPPMKDIHVWLSQDAWKLIKAAADKENRSVTNYVETVLLKHVGAP